MRQNRIACLLEGDELPTGREACLPRADDLLPVQLRPLTIHRLDRLAKSVPDE